MSEVTCILDRAVGGDPKAAAELLPLVCGELRRLAAPKMAHEAAGQTLQPTRSFTRPGCASATRPDRTGADAGLQLQEIAAVLNASEKTVQRDWRFAKTWLSREFQIRPSQRDARESPTAAGSS